MKQSLSGHGHFDMAAYEKHFSGELIDYEYPEDTVFGDLAHQPQVG